LGCEVCEFAGITVNIAAKIAVCMKTNDFIRSCISVSHEDHGSLSNLLIISFPALNADPHLFDLSLILLWVLNVDKTGSPAGKQNYTTTKKAEIWEHSIARIFQRMKVHSVKGGHS
jgi:hypothetical protein